MDKPVCGELLLCMPTQKTEPGVRRLKLGILSVSLEPEDRACKDQSKRTELQSHCFLEPKLGKSVAMCAYIREDLIAENLSGRP